MARTGAAGTGFVTFADGFLATALVTALAEDFAAALTGALVFARTTDLRLALVTGFFGAGPVVLDFVDFFMGLATSFLTGATFF
ncbi:MAG: hypothetical protein ABIP75_18565 [Pyrinomonadaceae bacterium]